MRLTEDTSYSRMLPGKQNTKTKFSTSTRSKTASQIPTLNLFVYVAGYNWVPGKRYIAGPPVTR